MSLKYTSNYDALKLKLQQMQIDIPHRGSLWAHHSAIEMDSNVREHLGAQGRGGAAPPLSSMTVHIYEVAGEPDGSGIHNHLTLEFRRQKNDYTAILGIPEGQPTVVAMVQEHGATIPVTDRMRGYLAAEFGIYLRSTTTHLHVPGRHFWSESLRKTKSSALKRLKDILQ